MFSEPLDHRFPAIASGSPLPLGRADAHHQPDVGPSGVVSGPLHLDPGAVGYLAGAGLGAPLAPNRGNSGNHFPPGAASPADKADLTLTLQFGKHLLDELRAGRGQLGRKVPQRELL